MYATGQQPFNVEYLTSTNLAAYRVATLYSLVYSYRLITRLHYVALHWLSVDLTIELHTMATLHINSDVCLKEEV